MKAVLGTIGVFLLVAVGYLLLWPVPIDPVAWQAPVDRGYVDPYAPNDMLRRATSIDLGDVESPEDATIGRDGNLYVSTKSGIILKVTEVDVIAFADAGGRPLGIEADHDGSLIVANAEIGLQRVTASGRVEVLLDAVDGQALNDANSLGIAADGTIYFSQSSTKFSAATAGGSYAASLLDLLEHGGHGNLYAFSPLTGEVARILTGLNYANGVAVSDDGNFLLVAETGHYRIIKFWLRGKRAGETEVLVENLPAFPDNIKNGLNGRFWIGFAAPRNALLDKLSGKPWLRKVIQRLPAALRPAAEPSSHVVAINGDGAVLMNLHEPDARFPTLTGAIETRDTLYLTSLFGNQLPLIRKRDL